MKQKFKSLLFIMLFTNPFTVIAATSNSESQAEKLNKKDLKPLYELLPSASIVASPIAGLKERKVISNKFEERKFYYYDPVTKRYEETLRPVQNEFKNDPALFGKNNDKKFIVPLGPFQDLF